MKHTSPKKLAALIICIVAALTILSTASFALTGTIESVDISQEPNGRSSFVTYTATIQGDQDISIANVFIQRKPADTCSLTAGKIVCTLTEEIDAAGEHDLLVELKEAGSVIHQKSDSFVVDVKNPTVSFTLQEEDNTFTINYIARDTACRSNNGIACQDICSGIQTIEIFNAGTSEGYVSELNEQNPEVIEVDTFNCQERGEFVLEKTYLLHGEQDIVVRVHDKAGLISESSRSITADITPPLIHINDVMLAKASTPTDIPIRSYGQSPLSGVTFSIIVEDEQRPSVTANLQALSGQDQQKTLSCLKTQGSTDQYECTTTFTLNTQQVTNEVQVRATDAKGNTAEETVIVSLEFDNAPELLELLPRNSLENQDQEYYVKTDDQEFVARFIEQSGFDKNNVFLRYGSSQTKRASSCETIETGEVECTFSDVPLSVGRTYQLSIDPRTKDVFGNEPTPDSIQQHITVIPSDTDFINDYEITVRGIQNNDVLAIDNKLVRGNAISMTAILSSEIPIELAEVDLSDVSGETNPLQAGCQQTADTEWECIWEENNIVTTNENKAELTFSFSDPAGNIFRPDPLIVDVVGFTDDNETNLWRINYDSIRCSPSLPNDPQTILVSRFLGSITNLTADCIIPLSKRNDHAISQDRLEAVSIELEDNTCTVVHPEEKNPFKKVSLYNNVRGSQNPVLKIEFQDGDQHFELDDIQLNCKLRIISEHKQTVNVPELDEFTIDIAFGDKPYGSLREQHQQQIIDKKKGLKSKVETLNTLMEIVKAAEKACKAYNLILTVKSVLLGGGAGFKEIALRLAGTPAAFAAPVLETVGSTMCGGENVLNQVTRGPQGSIITKACGWFVTCDDSVLRDNLVVDYLSDIPYVGANDDSIGTLGGLLGRVPREERSRILNVRNSLPLSAATLCVSGIIDNAHRLVQIGCQETKCMEYMLVTGRNPSYCENEADYMTCKYVGGQIFATLPFSAILDHMYSYAQSILTNPFSLPAVILELIPGTSSCKKTCAQAGGQPFIGCEGWRLTTEVIKVVHGILDLFDKIEDPTNYFTDGRDNACASIDFSNLDDA